MVRMASICLLLTLVVHLDLELFQKDVKITFFNGNVEEEIDQPISFVSKCQEDKVYHFTRSIYSLKQSFRLQNFKFHEDIISFGLIVISEDHYVYIKKTT